MDRKIVTNMDRKIVTNMDRKIHKKHTAIEAKALKRNRDRILNYEYT